MVLHHFRLERPRSYTPLTDTCFAGDDFSDVSWDMLYDLDGKDAYDEIMSKTKSEHEQKRQLMTERAKARENW
jgi:hypothetical protein